MNGPSTSADAGSVSGGAANFGALKRKRQAAFRRDLPHHPTPLGAYATICSRSAARKRICSRRYGETTVRSATSQRGTSRCFMSVSAQGRSSVGTEVVRGAAPQFPRTAGDCERWLPGR